MEERALPGMNDRCLWLVSVCVLVILLGGGGIARAEMYSTFGDGYSYNTSTGNTDYYILETAEGALGKGLAAPFSFEAGADEVAFESLTLPLHAFSGSAFSKLDIYIASDSGGLPGASFVSLPSPSEVSPEVSWQMYGNLLYADVTGLEEAFVRETPYWLVVQPKMPYDEALSYYWYANNQGYEGFADYLDQEPAWKLGTGKATPAFAINGPVPVPEPGSGVLLGVLGLGLCLRRRGRRS